MNYTVAADLSSSWDPSNVSWTEIDKGNIPPIDNPILWTRTDNKATYSFGGESGYGWISTFSNNSYDGPPVDLYQFNVNGRLTGNWSTIHAPSYSSGAGQKQSLNRPTKALGAVVGNTGFIVNGVEDDWSQNGNADIDQDVP